MVFRDLHKIPVVDAPCGNFPVFNFLFHPNSDPGARALGCFKCDTLSKKNCDASTIPSRAYINHIQKNFFPRTSLEGRPTWSKIGHPAVSICRKNLFFNNRTTPVNSLRGSQERLQHFFCPNTLPFFATDTYKLVAQGSLFI